MRNTVLVLASGLGLYISIYFALVYYNLIQPDARLVPRVCRLEENVCREVVFHRDARVFVVPNSLLGVVYYCAVLADVLFFSPKSAVLLYASWLTVAMSLYLVYSLFFVVRVVCLLCMTSHALNILIAVLLTFRVQT